MKKLGLFLTAVLFAFNANALDLVDSLNKVSATADSAAKTVEAQKAADEQAKANLDAAVEAKKNELEAKVAEQKAASDAKKAEQEKAVKDVKDSVNNLKKAFTN